MKTEAISITVNGKPVTCNIRKMKYRERMRVAGLLRKVPDEPGVEVDPDAPPRFTLASVSEYQVALIVASLCNESGKPFFTPDEIDEWDDADIKAVLTLDDEFNKTAPDAVEIARGNSAATANEGTSSA
jgi:hypothetical protein